MAEEKLRLEKRAHPGKIHYFIAASKELPGKFMLSYMPRGKARHEYVTGIVIIKFCFNFPPQFTQFKNLQSNTLEMCRDFIII